MQNAKFSFFFNPKSNVIELFFVQSKVAKAEHTLAYVSILLSADLCKKSQSERFSTCRSSLLYPSRASHRLL